MNADENRILGQVSAETHNNAENLKILREDVQKLRADIEELKAHVMEAKGGRKALFALLSAAALMGGIVGQFLHWFNPVR